MDLSISHYMTAIPCRTVFLSLARHMLSSWSLNAHCMLHSSAFSEYAVQSNICSWNLPEVFCISFPGLSVCGFRSQWEMNGNFLFSTSPPAVVISSALDIGHSNRYTEVLISTSLMMYGGEYIFTWKLYILSDEAFVQTSCLCFNCMVHFFLIFG